MKQKLHRITMLLFMLVVQFSYSQNQTITVTGTVSDQTGPLPGVVVIIQNTATGTQTDFDGNFSINVNLGATLEFSYVGMKSMTKTILDSSSLSIFLEEDTEALEEVVVVAFGKQTKKSIVGAIASVSDDIIDNQQITSVATALQGNVAGVNIISTGGQPGENPIIRIRGVSSINADASPLIIVDGAPYNGNLNTISGDQIESMNVLKDAASTSLYGSRGANGVILINTKRGKFNTPTKVSVKTTYGLSGRAVDRHELVNTDTFTQYTWEAIRNSNQYAGGMSPEDAASSASNSLVTTLGYNPYNSSIPVGTDGKLVSTDKKWDTDWGALIENNNAKRIEHTLGISGGSENTTHSFNLNYLDQEGSIQTSNFERVTTRLSIDTKVNKWFKTGVSLFYSTSAQNFPDQSGTSFTSTVQWINNLSSYYPLYRRDANGNFIYDEKGNTIYDYGNNQGALNAVRPQYQGENVVGSLYLYEKQYKRDNFTANGYMHFQILKDLSFKTQISYEKYMYDFYEYNHNEYGVAASVNGRVDQDRNFTTTKNIINTLNYNRKFGEHYVNVDLIHEAFERNINDLGAQGVGFLPNVKVLNGSTTPEAVRGAFTDETLNSFLSRVAYNYKEKYFGEISYRQDASSRFSPETRVGSFFAIGGSWILSEEAFIQNIDQIQFLKLRASYGELGNNKTQDEFGDPDYFPYLSLYETGWNELDNTGVILGNISDTGLTWEKTASSNIGIDFGMFGQYLNGSIDYYTKTSVDLIYDRPLPSSTGNDAIKTNVGSLKNYGIEVSLRSNIISNKNFKWTTGLNFSFDRNKITELTQESFINGTKRWEVGRSLYDFYLTEWAGVNPANGKGMWYVDIEDAEGDVIGRDVTEEYADATRNYVNKSSLPDMIGGFTNNLVYKQFDLNFLFNFSFGSYVYDSSYASLMNGMEDVGRAAHTDLQYRWQKPGDITHVPLLYNSQNDFTSRSDRFLFKNDYIRLKALTFGYNLPKTITNKMNISRLRLFMQGDNLFTWQSHKGLDPEQNLAGTTDSRSYNLKTVSLGLNLDF
ncbi:SusC/RagA family TonB-linked outer membrane protein [Flavicella marina]|uniref:SusC/RagA family TonB-linked outer membrane protein n=1 Tax=Flavicella marina TaxID=1475951 RepID=UPI0012644391|nr:TonB-dependent receptor [Flavicella marina]